MAHYFDTLKLLIGKLEKVYCPAASQPFSSVKNQPKIQITGIIWKAKKSNIAVLLIKCPSE